MRALSLWPWKYDVCECGKIKRKNARRCRGCFLSAPDRTPLMVRFAKFVSEPDENGCRKWIGSLNDNGYGQISDGDRTVLAHRASYTHYVGPIPEGMSIDHVFERGCRSTACVEAAHLEPVTQIVNVRRGERSRAEQCVRGHPFDDKNTYVWRGQRKCRACKRNWMRNHR